MTTTTQEIDYSIKENRVKALNDLNSDCLQAFRDSGLELSKDTIVDLNERSVEISVRETDKSNAYFDRSAFASEIRIYSKDFGMTRSLESELSVGSCGSFTPEYKPAYWRIIHAAEVLKNWKSVCEIVNTYCNKYIELGDYIRKSQIS